MRQLASIQKITDIRPIENADAIECASVLGWNVVVKKGEFKPGDLCIYCEVDSVLPEHEEFEFLVNKNYRIKTIRLRGVISQGICFPVDTLWKMPNVKKADPKPSNVPETACYVVDGDVISFRNIEEGTDVTSYMGITKYEPPVHYSLGGNVRGNFPDYIPKTDETRLQSVPWLLEAYRECVFYAAEKLDGSSATFFVKDGYFGVCSRNLQIDRSEGNAFWKAVDLLDIENKMLSLNRDIAIQGELIGPSIQKNKYKLDDVTVRFFNAYDIRASKYLSYSELNDLVTVQLGLSLVPIVMDNFRLSEIGTTVSEFVDFVTRDSLFNFRAKMEGMVFRPVDEVYDLKLGRLSFKVINPEFLLKHDE